MEKKFKGGTLPLQTNYIKKYTIIWYKYKNYKTGNVESNESEIHSNGYFRWRKHGDNMRNHMIRSVQVTTIVQKINIHLSCSWFHRCGHGRASLQHGDLATRAVSS